MTIYESSAAVLRWLLQCFHAFGGHEESNRAALPSSLPHKEPETRPACMCCICEEKASQVKCERINALVI